MSIRSRILEHNELTKPENKRGVSTRNFRSKEQREADLALISKLLVRENLTRQELADRVSAERPYKMSVHLAHIDVQELYKRWRDAYLDDIDILKGRELQRIDELEAAYWDSYERSLKGINMYKEDVVEVEVDMIGVEDSESPTKRKKFASHKFQDERDGESKFLNGIQWCITKRCEILGLNAPVKSELTFDWRSEAERQGFDPTLMYNEVVKQFVDGNIIDAKEIK